MNNTRRPRLRSVASIALGLWFLAVKTCLTLALEAIHAMLVGRRSDKMLSPSSYEKGIHRNQSIISSRRRVRIRRSSGESSAAASRTGSEAEGEDNESNGGGGGGCSGGAVNGTDNTVYHSRTIKLRYRSSLKKRKEQVQYKYKHCNAVQTQLGKCHVSRLLPTAKYKCGYNVHTISHRKNSQFYLDNK